MKQLRMFTQDRCIPNCTKRQRSAALLGPRRQFPSSSSRIPARLSGDRGGIKVRRATEQWHVSGRAAALMSPQLSGLQRLTACHLCQVQLSKSPPQMDRLFFLSEFNEEPSRGLQLNLITLKWITLPQLQTSLP
ncbi:hypothetical protein AGIG_G5382 [Arapaima gigas]